MGKGKKFYYLCGCLIIATMMSLLFEQKFHIAHVDDVFNLLLIFASIGLCITSKLILNKEMVRVFYLIINILISNGIIKLTVLGYCNFNKMKYMQANITYEALKNHLLVTNVLQISSLFIISGLLMGKIKHVLELWNGLNVICICLLVVINKYSMAWVEPIDRFIKWAFTIGLCSLFRLDKSWRKKFPELPEKDIYFYKLFLMICTLRMLIEMSAMLTDIQFNITLTMLLFLEWVLLFIYCYLTCVVNPWKNKKRLLLEVGSNMAFQQEQSEHIVSLSHELKTPVNVIRSGLDLILLDEKIESNTLQELRSLKAICNEIMNIIQNMIDVQKIEGKHISNEFQVYNIVEVVENVVDAFGEQRQCEFLFNPLEEELFQELDIHLFQQSFMLLISLLIKKECAGQIYIEMGKTSDENKGVVIKIQHERIVFLEELSNNLDELMMRKEDEMELLTMHFIKLVCKLHSISMQYSLEEEKNILELVFPICYKQSEEWLDEENIELLKEQIKARGLMNLL